MTTRDILVPITSADLTVLEWYAAWTPAVHRADWKHRRTWPPGFRRMEDLSCPSFSDRDNTVENAVAKMMDGPLLPGDTVQKRRAARGRLKGLLSYRLIEGSRWGEACRLTARGRAALKLHGRACPDGFESHCDDIFDFVSLLPVQGRNTKIEEHDLRDTIGRRYASGVALPDDESTWRLMLAEYRGQFHLANSATNSGKARLGIHSGDTYLCGSMRQHHRYVSIDITDAETRESVISCAMSFEGLAELLVGNMEVPVTISGFRLSDGMRYDRPVPPPVSVSQRMAARIELGTSELLRRIDEVAAGIKDSKLGVRAQAELLNTLGIIARDVATHGAFAAQQATDEMSSVAESLLVLMRERVAGAGDAFPLLGAGPSPVTAKLLTDGEAE